MGKLEKRIASVIGCFLSMNGFTADAVGEVYLNLGKRLILCFGNKDIGSWVAGTTDFDDLIKAKIKAAFTKREVSWQ